jgi:hypothetical protein
LDIAPLTSSIASSGSRGSRPKNSITPTGSSWARIGKANPLRKPSLRQLAARRKPSLPTTSVTHVARRSSQAAPRSPVVYSSSSSIQYRASAASNCGSNSHHHAARLSVSAAASQTQCAPYVQSMASQIVRMRRGMVSSTLRD